MSDLLTEIKDDLKRERFEKLFKKYGKYVIAIAIVAIGCSVGVTIYKNQQLSAQISSGQQYRQALLVSTPSDLAQLDKAIKNGTQGYANFSTISKAKLHIKNNEIDQAITAYSTIIDDKNADKAIQAFSELQIINLMINQNAASSAILSKITNLENYGGVWRYSAMEAKAALALQNKDYEQAKTLLQALSDDVQAPSKIKLRAQKLLVII